MKAKKIDLKLKIVPFRDLSETPHLVADSDQVNKLILNVRQNPRRVGELGYCPKYVPEGKQYALSGKGIMEIT